MSELKEVFDNDELLSGYLESVKLADFRAEVRQLVVENGSSHNTASTPCTKPCGRVGTAHVAENVRCNMANENQTILGAWKTNECGEYRFCNVCGWANYLHGRKCKHFMEHNSCSGCHTPICSQAQDTIEICHTAPNR